MKLLFARSHWPGSYLIRWLTFSQWSHVAVISPDGTEAIEATWPRVRRTTPAAIIAAHSAHEWRQIDVPDEAAAWAFAEAQIGKLYDLGGIVALPFQRRDWQSAWRWFCSELAAGVIHAGGLALFSDASRVTPEVICLASRPLPAFQ